MKMFVKKKLMDSFNMNRFYYHDLNAHFPRNPVNSNFAALQIDSLKYDITENLKGTN